MDLSLRCVIFQRKSGNGRCCVDTKLRMRTRVACPWWLPGCGTPVGRLMGAPLGQGFVDLCVLLAPDAKIPRVGGRAWSGLAPLLNQKIRQLFVWFGFLIRIHSVYEIEVLKPWFYEISKRRGECIFNRGVVFFYLKYCLRNSTIS